MRKAALLLIVLLVTACSESGDGEAAAAITQPSPTPTDGYVVVDSFPHDVEAFTQGLLFHGKTFYESTGLEGASSIRKVDLATGEILKKVDLAAEYFGEGITTIGDRIWQLTWQDEIGFKYDRKTFKRTGSFKYKGEGWGLTDNTKQIVMSNGTDVITFRSPETFKVKRKINVTDGGQPVTQLNEIEWIEGEIWANVWQTTEIVRIDPSTGKVTDRIDFRALVTKEQAEEREGQPDVLNGIAYLASEDRIFVTGKWWKYVYEIELVEP